MQVDAYVAKAEPLVESIRATGTLLANEQVDITSETSGRVTGIRFQEGSRVRQGQVLVQLNEAELRAQLSRAKQRAQLTAAQEYRQRILLEKQAVSQQEYDVVAADAAIAKADVELIQAQVAQTTIRAPFHGTIGLRQIAVGTYLTPGTRIATLQNLDQVKLEFAVPEKYAEKIRVGTKVTFNLRNGNKGYKATVFALEPRIETDTRTLLVRARAANADGSLVPGSFADIEIGLSREDNAILIPASAIVPQQNGQAVYISKGGKASIQQVTTGTRLAERVQIETGVSVGDTVITTGLQLLRPGASVNPVVAQ